MPWKFLNAMKVEENPEGGSSAENGNAGMSNLAGGNDTVYM